MWWSENFSKIFSRNFSKIPGSVASVSRRSAVVGLCSLPIAACGFRPVYGPGGPGQELRGRVAIADPENRLSFGLVTRLEERLGRSQVPAYELSYQISTRRAGLAISETNDTTRVRIDGAAQYLLREASTDRQLIAGEVSSFTAFSTTGSTLATDAAARDAEERLMILLADLMVDALIAGAARFA